MNERIILSKFITREQLEVKESKDGRYLVTSGSKINKSYEKINGIKYNLERSDRGYVLSINVPNKFTKKICNMLGNYYHSYECHFKAKMIETLIDTRMDCISHEDIKRNILNVENYLESNEFYTYSERVYLRWIESSQCYENKVLYPMNVYLEKINISGGIIIGRSPTWMNSLLMNQEKNLILSIDGAFISGGIGDVNIDILNIDSDYTDNYSEIIKNYDRVFFDCSRIDNLDKLISILGKHKGFYNKIKSKNKWIVVSEVPIIRDIILDLINFLCNKTVNYPIIEGQSNGGINLRTSLNGIILNINNKNRNNPKVNISRYKINFNECEKYILYNLPKNISYDVIDELDKIDSVIQTSEIECPICMDTIGVKFICKTICDHIYCIRCLVLSLQEKNQCPICRCNITMNSIMINKFGNSSKIEAIIRQIKLVPIGMRTIIYIRNQTLIKNIYNILTRECEFSVMLCIGSKQNRMRTINEFNKDIYKSIILVQSKDYELGRYIAGVKYIMISDYDYRYVINRMTMGNDFYNNKTDIYLIILEYPSIEKINQITEE